MILVAVLVLFVASGLCLGGLLRGPTIYDRIIAADSIGVNSAVIIVLLACYYQAWFLLDVALVYGVLLFVDMLIFAKYLERRELVR